VSHGEQGDKKPAMVDFMWDKKPEKMMIFHGI